MPVENGSRISHVLERYESEILSDWMKELSASGVRRDDLMKESELRQQAQDFLRLARQATRDGQSDVESPAWAEVRDMLGAMSRTRAAQGFTPTQTATFVLSFKRPLFNRLRTEAGRDTEALAADVWTATELLDKLGLYTTEVFQNQKEEIIGRQQDRKSTRLNSSHGYI